MYTNHSLSAVKAIGLPMARMARMARMALMVLVAMSVATAVLAAPTECLLTADERAQLKAIYQARSSAERARMLKGLRDDLAFKQKRAEQLRAQADAAKTGLTQALEMDVKRMQCVLALLTS